MTRPCQIGQKGNLANFFTRATCRSGGAGVAGVVGSCGEAVEEERRAVARREAGEEERRAVARREAGEEERRAVARRVRRTMDDDEGGGWRRKAWLAVARKATSRMTTTQSRLDAIGCTFNVVVKAGGLSPVRGCCGGG